MEGMTQIATEHTNADNSQEMIEVIPAEVMMEALVENSTLVVPQSNHTQDQKYQCLLQNDGRNNVKRNRPDQKRLEKWNKQHQIQKKVHQLRQQSSDERDNKNFNRPY